MTDDPTPTPQGRLLAIDLGVRAGLAVYGPDGRLERYQSQNFGDAARLKRAMGGVLRAVPELRHLIAEGDRTMGLRWAQEAARLGAETRLVSAEDWRADLLWSRQRRTGADAKRHAEAMARRVIAWSGAPGPTSLRHDAAEAILLGLWGATALGWLSMETARQVVTGSIKT